ncbi:hypothetical protein ABW20_dc0108330 [Dactylellina cionopaga]|nr:hypothetical protein ABW20_dc0108330 [Dactylellina cionopaga]
MESTNFVVALPIATFAIIIIFITAAARQKSRIKNLHYGAEKLPVVRKSQNQEVPETASPCIAAEYDTQIKTSMELQKELYYKLQNLEQYPEVLPQARDVLILLFSETLERASKAPNEGILSIKKYSREALLTFQQDDHKKTLDLFEQYIIRRRAKGSREMFKTREEAKWWLIQSSPVKYVDGAWLGHINKITTPFGLRRVVKNAWQVLSEELGDGDLEKHHVYIYRKLMEAVDLELPAGDDIDFIHPRHQLNEPGIWKAAVAQLLISLFPHQFLPEILGFNMHYEGLALETLKVAKELRELGFDPYYFLLHISIDNADSGHTAMAIEAVIEYIELVQRRDGNNAVRQAWRRIQAGYILSKHLPTAPVCPTQKKEDTIPAQTRKIFPRNELEGQVIQIFKAKAEVSQKIHCTGRIKFGGYTIAEWFAPGELEAERNQMNFLDALSSTKPWIYKGNSARSRFMTEISWKGRMFGSFTQSEVYTIQQWIDSLNSDGEITNPKLYWSFISEAEIDSQKALQNQDIRVHHPVFAPFPTNSIVPKLLPSAYCLSRAPGIDLSVFPSFDKLFPLWFTHPCLLEHFVCVPAKTTTLMGCAVLRVLRAQSGFNPEDPMVAGMDEFRQSDSIGLVELGLQMVRMSGHNEPTSLKEVLDNWPSDFGLLMLHLCKSPTENTGLLLGLAVAFVSLHEALSLSPLLLPTESLRLLRTIAARERESLEICVQELQSTPSQFLEFCRGYHLGMAEIDRCFEQKIKL